MRMLSFSLMTVYADNRKARFDYQIGAVWASPQGREAFQDIMVHAFRSTSPS